MNDARDVVLGKIRDALRDVPAVEQPADVPVDRSYRTIDSDSLPQRIRLFVERVSEYKARIRTVLLERAFPGHRRRLCCARRAAAGGAGRSAGGLGTRGR